MILKEHMYLLMAVQHAESAAESAKLVEVGKGGRPGEHGQGGNGGRGDPGGRACSDDKVSSYNGNDLKRESRYSLAGRRERDGA